MIWAKRPVCLRKQPLRKPARMRARGNRLPLRPANLYGKNFITSGRENMARVRRNKPSPSACPKRGARESSCGRLPLANLPRKFDGRRSVIIRRAGTRGTVTFRAGGPGRFSEPCSGKDTKRRRPAPSPARPAPRPAAEVPPTAPARPKKPSAPKVAAVYPPPGAKRPGPEGHDNCNCYDSKTEIGRVSPLFAQKKSRDRRAPEPGHLPNPGGGEAARTAGSIFQTSLTCPPNLPPANGRGP